MSFLVFGRVFLSLTKLINNGFYFQVLLLSNTEKFREGKKKQIFFKDISVFCLEVQIQIQIQCSHDFISYFGFRFSPNYDMIL